MRVIMQHFTVQVTLIEHTTQTKKFGILISYQETEEMKNNHLANGEIRLRESLKGKKNNRNAQNIWDQTKLRINELLEFGG